MMTVGTKNGDRHFVHVQRLSEWIEQPELRILEHSYYPATFGSWFVVVGRGRGSTWRRLIWDRKDGYIRVEARISRQENSERSWEEIDHRRDHARNQEEIFETVQDLIAEQFDLDIDQPEP